MTGAPSGLKRRRALASLEMVLVLPLLVLLAAMTYTIGRVGLHKAGANVQARREARVVPAGRGAAEQAPLPSPLSGQGVIRAGEARGLSSANVERSVNIAPVAQATVKVRGRLVMLLDPLDHVTAPFPYHDRFTPDSRASRLVTTSLSSLGSVVNGLGDLAKKAKDKMGDAADKMSKIKDDQAEQLKKQRKEKLEEIQKVLKDKNLSAKEREEKVKKLKEELDAIDKAEKGLKDMSDSFGKMTGGS